LVNSRWTLFLSELSDPDVSGRAFLTVRFNTGSWYVRSQAMPTQAERQQPLEPERPLHREVTRAMAPRTG
jgi:hypothetical protein